MNSLFEIANTFAARWLDTMWPIIWQSTALCGIVYLLTLCLKRASATVRFWLWMLVPLRLLVMPLITVTLPLLPAAPQVQSPDSGPLRQALITEPAVIETVETAQVADEFGPTSLVMENGNVVATRIWPNVSALLMAAWLAGVTFWSVRLFRGWCRIRRVAGRADRVSEGQILASAQKAAAMLGLRRMPRIMVTEESVSPFLFGVLRPALVIPAGLTGKVHGEVLFAVFAHEFAHLRRRDPLVGWVLAICEAIYFFHPAFYFVKRRILFEREKASDNWVVATCKARRSIYANALISAADVCRTFSTKVGPVGAVAESFGDLKKRHMAISQNLKPKARLSMSVSILLVIIGAICVPGIVLTARPKSDSPALETVRQLVARNEARINPIKMNYTIKSSRTAEPPQPVGGRRAGRRYSHRNIVWAQSGLKQYVETNSFYGPDELARSSVKVFDDRVKTEGNLPDLMEGYISLSDRHYWYDVVTAKLRMRPFEGRHLLSEILVPGYAMLHSDIETVGGRPTYVVDVTKPDATPYHVRMWIDKEAGIPLRTRIFYQHPTVQGSEVSLEVNEIEPHRLPNGGWIPIAGVRALHFRRSNPPYTSYEHVSVDVNSITTKSEDIPESLFRIEFPDGASIYNVISGLTSVKGQPLKTYEQVVNSANRFIAGTVIDQSGAPVSDVVVGPLAVATQQSDGRFSHRLLQGPERLCAITDARGRFAIELEQDGRYDLLFFPKDFVDKRLRDVPLGEHELRVTLSKGGTVTGRVVRMVKGRRTPVADVEVEAREASRIQSLNLRYGRTRTTTDSEGRFQIKYLATRKRKRQSGNPQEQQDVPVLWEIRCGPASQTIQFEDEVITKDVELVLKPDPSAAPPLVGRPLPGFENIDIKFKLNNAKGKKILICFWDMGQRPSRNLIRELAKREKKLRDKGIVTLLVHTPNVEPKKLDEWLGKYQIPFVSGIIKDDPEEVLFRWAVPAEPWLVLADENRIVRLEGFGLEDIDRLSDQSSRTNRTGSEHGPATHSQPENKKEPSTKTASLQVRVTYQQDGTLIEGARVSFTNETTGQSFKIETAANGIARVDVEPGDYAMTNVSKEGYRSHKKDVQMTAEAGKADHIDIELVDAPKVSGCVRDQNGKPVPGTSVHMVPYGPAGVVTDAAGQFKFKWDPRRIRLFLVARHVKLDLAGSVEFYKRGGFPIYKEGDIVEMSLDTGLTLAGRVTDANGSGIAGANVAARIPLGSSARAPVAQAKTDPNGHYEIKALPLGHQYRLEITCDGYGPQTIEGWAQMVSGTFETMQTVKLNNANLAVAGVVVDANGQPMDAAKVVCWWTGQPRHEAETDANGKFLIEGVCRGKLRIQATKERLRGVVDTEGGSQNVKIVLEESEHFYVFGPRRRPESAQPPASLVGKSLPGFEDIDIKFKLNKAKGKKILICFWDMNQRPSRNLIGELAKRADELQKKEVIVILVHTSDVDTDKLKDWLANRKIPFTYGSIKNDIERVLFSWGVRAQPWLVLTNEKGVVRAGGFGLDQLDEKLREKDFPQTSGKQESVKSDKIVFKLIDSNGRPVAGAKVGTNVRTRDITVLGSKLSWNLRGREHNISNEWGEIILTREELFSPSWSADRKLALYVLHEDRQIGAVRMISRDGRQEEFELTLEPVCHVHGRLDSEALKKMGRPLTWTNVYLYWDRDSFGVLSHMPDNKRFEFFVPPGQYTLNAYGSGEGASTKNLYPEIEVKANQSELDLGVIDLPPTKVTSLIGKPAPELGPIKAWKNGTPVKLADLRGKLVILHFGGGYPSTSRDLPRLVELHEEFEKAGLVIISLYNCESMKQLEERFAEVSKKYGGEPDVPFRLAVDGGKGRPIEGTDRTIPGDTYAAYDISGYPTIVLINREGKIAEKLNLSGAKKKLENMLGVTVKAALPAWRQRFDKVYRLEEGQVLKRIAPPFIAQRKEYYQQEESRQAEAIERPPDYFTFHWDGKLKKWGLGFTGGKRPLSGVLNSTLRIDQDKFEGPEELLQTQVPGDWIVREGASEEQKLKALEEILVKEIGRHIRFEKRTVEREAIVATGSFKYHRLPVMQDDRWIHMFSDDLTPGGGGGGGTADSVSEFLQAIGNRVGMPVIDQTESREEIRIPYRHHRSAYLSRVQDPTEKAEKLILLLDNLSHQTNLQFTVGRRPVEIWFLTEENEEK